MPFKTLGAVDARVKFVVDSQASITRHKTSKQKHFTMLGPSSHY